MTLGLILVDSTNCIHNVVFVRFFPSNRVNRISCMVKLVIEGIENFKYYNVVKESSGDVQFSG